MAAPRDDLNSIPKNFLCPITGKIMLDPVTIPTGSIFERANIIEIFNSQLESWGREHFQNFSGFRFVDPITQKPSKIIQAQQRPSLPVLKPTPDLKNKIIDWRKTATKNKSDSQILDGLAEACSLVECHLSEKHFISASNAFDGIFADFRNYSPLLTLTNPFQPIEPFTAADYIPIARVNVINGHLHLFKSTYGIISIEMLQQAISIYDYFKMENLQNELHKALVLLGVAYLKEQNYTQAEWQFKRAATLIPSKTGALLEAGLGEIERLAHKKIETAFKHYQAAVTIGNDTLATIIALNGLGSIPIQQKDLSKAYFSKLIQMYVSPESVTTDLEKIIGSNFLIDEFTLLQYAYIERACFSYQLNLLADTLKDFNYLLEKIDISKGLASLPSPLRWVIACRSRILAESPELREAHSERSARKQLEKIVSTTSHLITPLEIKSIRIEAQMARAAANFHLGKLSLSLRDYNQLIKQNLGCHAYRANVYMAQKKIDLAVLDNKTVLEYLTPQDTPYKIKARHSLCQIVQYLLTTHQPLLAEEVLQEMSYRQWPPEEVSYNYASAYMIIAKLQQKQISQALVAFEEFNALQNPSDVLATLKQTINCLLLETCNKLAMTRHYEMTVKACTTLLKYKPDFKISITQCLLRAACYTRQVEEALTHFQTLVELSAAQKDILQPLIDMMVYYFKFADSHDPQPFLEKVIKTSDPILKIFPKNIEIQKVHAEACRLLCCATPIDPALQKMNFAKTAMKAYRIVIANAHHMGKLADVTHYTGQYAITDYESGIKSPMLAYNLLEVINNDPDCPSTIPAYLSATLAADEDKDPNQAVYYAQMALSKTRPNTEERRIISSFYENALSRRDHPKDTPLPVSLAWHSIFVRNNSSEMKNEIPKTCSSATSVQLSKK